MVRGQDVGRRIALLFLIGACSADEVKDPSYLLLDLAPAGANPPGAARVAITSGTTSLANACIHLGSAGAASLVLKRDSDKDPNARITITVTAFGTLSGQDNVGPGDEFACPAAPPPALGEPQSVEVAFCPTEAKRLVFHLGSTCDCPADGGEDGASSSSSSSSSASTSSSSGGGFGRGGSGGSGGTGGQSGTGGIAGNGGAGGAGGASASSTAASSSASSSSSSTGAGGGAVCGCTKAQTCGAGLSTEGRACNAGECCNIQISTPCALEAAK